MHPLKQVPAGSQIHPSRREFRPFDLTSKLQFRAAGRDASNDTTTFVSYDGMSCLVATSLLKPEGSHMG